MSYACKTILFSSAALRKPDRCPRRTSQPPACLDNPILRGWEVADLGSRNGTQIDGVTIAAPHNLQEGETIGVGGCRITFSRSLQGAFSASRTAARAAGTTGDRGADGAEIDARMTQDLERQTAIVHRRADSQWSAANLTYPSPIAQREPPARADRWGFFYRLVFELVRCETREQLAQVALERLLEELGLAAGGVVTIESASLVGDANIKLDETIDAAATEESLPPLAVLATRQPDGESYHRVSDFLVRTLIRDRQAVLARNVMDDSQLALARESAARNVVSIICAPLRVRVASAVATADDQPIVGILHVYSAGEERMLSDADLELAVGVADNLAIALDRHAANERLSQSLAQSRRQIDHLHEQLDSTTELVGRSQALERVRAEIRRAAPTQATVLIRGESGVGKELVARAIHRQSKRRDGPLVCLNCAALAPTLLESELFGHEKGAFTGATERKIGKFEAAHEGTLLLDEIGEMPSELQAKFLRVLEGQPFERLGGNKPIQTDVRVLAATNRDLEEAVRDKEFRADLYFRLRVIEIDVPPLRSRLDDVPPLVEFFIEQLRPHAGRRLSGIEPDALELLARHTWPGNVRELRNVLERAIVLGNHATIGVEDLKLSTLGQPAAGTDQGSLDNQPDSSFEPISLSELERRHILAMLEHCAGNKTKAAQKLGIERSTLDRKLKRY
ncbi:MAG: sigma 54-interacting transcriptional regulator [Pirellulaceae bacterium]